MEIDLYIDLSLDRSLSMEIEIDNCVYFCKCVSVGERGGRGETHREKDSLSGYSLTQLRIPPSMPLN